jgi:hypothetical protein
MKRFQAFCEEFNVTDPFPVSEALLCRFVAFLALKGLAPTSMKTYLAAVRHKQILYGFPEPRETGTLPRLKLVLRGVARQRIGVGISQKPRLPVTIEVLGKIFQVWSQRTLTWDIALLWSVSSLAFFGFFRIGELLLPTKNGYVAAHHLSWGDVTTDSRSDPGLLCVHLKMSKCDQLGKGVGVYVGRTGSKLCPVAATLSYMAFRGPIQGPFFLLEDGTPLTKSVFTFKVREALTEAGLDPTHYAGHSFRIGAATAAAQIGLEDSTIKSLGRWSSSAFLSYIRTPRDQLASYTSQLAGTH